MKKMIFTGAAVMFVSSLLAQMKPPTYNSGGDEGHKGFKKENIFVGGSLGVGFAGNTFSVGGNPEIGYSIAQWLDAGIVVNLNYYSQSANADPNPYDYDYDGNIRTRQFNYGGGAFIRVYPVNFLFLQIQPEENWIHYNLADFNPGGGTTTGTANAFSLIGGVGYTRRVVGQSSYFILLGLDLANNLYSPYRENGVAIPIVRAGFDFYLKSSRRR